MNRLAVLSLAFLMVGSSTGITMGSSPIVERRWGPAVQRIISAARAGDAGSREIAVRQAIEAGLLHSDRKTRDEVFSFLSQNNRWIDLRPYGDILEQFGKVDGQHRGLWLLDEAELAHGPREMRLGFFQKAIVNGGLTLPHGRGLPRELAMSFAAIQGLAELEPLVERYADQVEERWKKGFEFETFPVLFRLGSGAQDREDALLLASQRLSATAGHEVKAKMDGDAGFRGAVLQVARDVCATDPFSDRRNPGCTDMKNVIGRQIALERDARKSEMESSEPGSAVRSENKVEGWLTRLRQHVPDAEIVYSRR